MKRWYSHIRKDQQQQASLQSKLLGSPDSMKSIDAINNQLLSTEEREQEELFQNLTPREEKEDFMESLDQYLMAQSKKFIKYRLNIFLLNKVIPLQKLHNIGCAQNLALVLRDQIYTKTSKERS